MKLISWNSRGLESPQGIRVVCDLVKKEDLDILFLQETKVIARKMGTLKFSLGFEDYLAVDSEGTSGV